MGLLKSVMYCEECKKAPGMEELHRQRCNCGGRIRQTYIDTVFDTPEAAMERKAGRVIGEERRKAR